MMKFFTPFYIVMIFIAQELTAADIYATFNVKANKEATLAFTASGTIVQSRVDVGSVVRKGEILARLENSEQKMILALAKQDLANAKVEALKHENSFKRYTKIKEILDQEKYEQIIFAKNISQNSALKAQFNVKLRQSQLDKTFIKAPFDGVITDRQKEVGDAVTGMQVMPGFEIMDMSSIKLILEFDERYWDHVKVGQMFRYTVDGSDEKLEGLISKVYPSANSKNRKVKAEVITKNLKPGLFGQGYIKVQ